MKIPSRSNIEHITPSLSTKEVKTLKILLVLYFLVSLVFASSQGAFPFGSYNGKDTAAAATAPESDDYTEWCSEAINPPTGRIFCKHGQHIDWNCVAQAEAQYRSTMHNTLVYLCDLQLNAIASEHQCIRIAREDFLSHGDEVILAQDIQSCENMRAKDEAEFENSYEAVKSAATQTYWNSVRKCCVPNG